MSSWLRASALAAAVSAAAALQATATDLYNGYPPPPRTGSAYDDPRYADLYGNGPPPRPVPYEERRYAAPYAPSPAPHGYGYPPIPREPVYRDAYPYPRQYTDARPYPSPGTRAYSAGPACLGKDEISDQLARDGWRDFHDPRVIDQGTAFVKARRAGRTFQLKVDRCSGDVIGYRPLDPRPGPYADYERPYRSY